MHDPSAQIPEIVIGLLVAVAGLVWLARKARVAYPIFLVLGGLGIALVPGMPRVTAPPPVVFLLFLPPLLYAAGTVTTWRDFRANLRPISMLAIGLVLATTAAVAAVAHYLIGMPWAAGFVLGAIISPPDAIAATSILQRLRVPRRIVTILEGESLVNDATALVAYSFAIEAVRTGRFDPGAASLQFFVVAIGGIVIGYFVGYVVCWARKHLRGDDSLAVLVSLLTPYVAYLPAEWCKVSGVLAAVTCGLYVGRQLPRITSSHQRLRLFSIWDAFTFILNGVVFILIGLTLPQVVSRLGTNSLKTMSYYAFIVGLTAIVVRFVWVFVATYANRALPSIRKKDPMPPLSWLTLMSWAGMRGIVSLAAALALPIAIAGEDSPAFPFRDEIVFITFGVILITLVGQGLTLGPLIRSFKLDADDNDEREEALARRELAFAALARLDTMEIIDGTDPKLIDEVRHDYARRVQRCDRTLSATEETVAGMSVAGASGAGTRHDPCCSIAEIEVEALAAERAMLIKLRDDSFISDEVLRRVQNELDIEDIRLNGGS